MLQGHSPISRLFKGMSYYLKAHANSLVLAVDWEEWYFPADREHCKTPKRRSRWHRRETRFKASYRVGGREPLVVCDEYGIGLECILQQIQSGVIRKRSEQHDADVIHCVFPSVLDVYSLQMFDHIYRNRGFPVSKPLSSEEEERLLKPSRQCSWIDFTRHKTAAINAEVIKAGGQLILRVVAETVLYCVVFLFSRGYAACSEPHLGKSLMTMKGSLSAKSFGAIAEFDEAYPEYGLRRYAERYGNILMPMIAGDYHCGLELAAKAGAVTIAEKYIVLDAFKKPPHMCRNLREMFGLPVKILSQMDRECISQASVERLKEIYEYNPEFLNFDKMNAAMFQFLCCADVTHCGYGTIVDVTTNLTDKQVLRILRYLSARGESSKEYCNYLKACEALGELVFGLMPRIALDEAYIRAFFMVKSKEDTGMIKAFRSSVGSDEYQSLTTCRTEEDRETFKDCDFTVIAPQAPEDLCIESNRMRNCVRNYISDVAGSRTRIYFLRKKSAIDKCYGTLEVSPNKITGSNCLKQAKAFANRKLSEDAQEFLFKWCEVKEIQIGTWDIKSDEEYEEEGVY